MRQILDRGQFTDGPNFVDIEEPLADTIFRAELFLALDDFSNAWSEFLGSVNRLPMPWTSWKAMCPDSRLQQHACASPPLL